MDYSDTIKVNNELDSIVRDCDKRVKRDHNKKKKFRLFRSVDRKVSRVQLFNILGLLKK